MKKLILAVAACLSIAACTQTELGSEPQEIKTKKFTFTLKGDFSDQWKPVTRGYLSADGKDLTDVWVLDYDADGNLLQQLHQADATADDFGRPVMQLAYGQHRVYFVASRGLSPVLDADAKTLTFGSVRDTFWKRYDVTVVATSNGNRAVTLDRVVTKLRLTFTDEIPASAATILLTPAKWYYGIDYTTGQPVSETANRTTEISIPDANKGQTGVQASIFGFSTATEWTTDVAISSKTVSGEVLGSSTLSAVPFKANRVTDFSGPLFSAGGTLALSLNAEWDEPATGTW